MVQWPKESGKVLFKIFVIMFLANKLILLKIKWHP